MDDKKLDVYVCMLGLVGVTIARKKGNLVMDDVDRLWAGITDEGISVEVQRLDNIKSTFAYKNSSVMPNLHYLDTNVACIRKEDYGLPFLLSEFENGPKFDREYEFDSEKRIYVPAIERRIPPKINIL